MAENRTNPTTNPYYARYAEVLPGFELGRLLVEMTIDTSLGSKVIQKGTWYFVNTQSGNIVPWDNDFVKNPIKDMVHDFLRDKVNDGVDDAVVEEIKTIIKTWENDTELMAGYGKFMMYSQQFSSNLQRGFEIKDITDLVKSVMQTGFHGFGFEDQFMFVFDYMARFVEVEASHISLVDSDIFEKAHKSPIK